MEFLPNYYGIIHEYRRGYLHPRKMKKSHVSDSFPVDMVKGFHPHYTNTVSEYQFIANISSTVVFSASASRRSCFDIIVVSFPFSISEMILIGQDAFFERSS